MDVWHGMVKSASGAVSLMRPEAVASVSGFVKRTAAGDGGFKGRDRCGDLYYSVFGMACCVALGLDWDRPGLSAFLKRFGDGVSLDLPHLSSLALCRRMLGDAPPADGRLLERIETYRTRDGGYARSRGAATSEMPACLLAALAYEAAARPQADRARLTEAMCSALSEPVAVKGNARQPSVLTTPEVAAGVVLAAVPAPDIAWRGARMLAERACRDGGFKATNQAPGPDLLSTATAVHALAAAGHLERVSMRGHLNYAESLWTESGGFCGSVSDPVPDCEYTFYGLLALGSVAGGTNRC